MMYGKHFASMYEGSMVGAGSHVFAVMGYIIAKQVPDKTVGSQVRLNPALLSAILGDSPERVQQAIDYLCAPDPKSNTPDKEGRRLVQVGQFDYQVVNGALYQAIRNEEDRRTQNREAKRRERANKASVKKGGGAMEKAFVAAEKNGDQAAADQIAAGPHAASVPVTPPATEVQVGLQQVVLGQKPQ